MGLGKKMSFSWKLLKWIYSVLEKSSSSITLFMLQNAISNYNSTLDKSRNQASMLEEELQVIDLDIEELEEKVWEYIIR